MACSIFQTLQERGWNNCGYKQRQGALLLGRHRRWPQARDWKPKLLQIASVLKHPSCILLSFLSLAYSWFLLFPYCLLFSVLLSSLHPSVCFSFLPQGKEGWPFSVSPLSPSILLSFVPSAEYLLLFKFHGIKSKGKQGLLLLMWLQPHHSWDY